MKMAYQKLFKLSLILETMLRKTLVITWQQTSSSISTAVTFVKILNSSLVPLAIISRKKPKIQFSWIRNKSPKMALLVGVWYSNSSIVNKQSQTIPPLFFFWHSDISSATFPPQQFPSTPSLPFVLERLHCVAPGSSLNTPQKKRSLPFPQIFSNCQLEHFKVN